MDINPKVNFFRIYPANGLYKQTSTMFYPEKVVINYLLNIGDKPSGFIGGEVKKMSLLLKYYTY